jgi:hypothetical protein
LWRQRFDLKGQNGGINKRDLYEDAVKAKAVKRSSRNSDASIPSTKARADSKPRNRRDLSILGAVVVFGFLITARVVAYVIGGEPAVGWHDWFFAGNALGTLSLSNLCMLFCVFLYWMLVLRHRR